MVTIAGITAGTAMIATLGATPLQPATVQRVDNNTLKVYTSKNMDINITHAKGFEVVIDKGGEPIKQTNNSDRITVKHVKAGTTLNISVLGGYNTNYLNVVGHKQIISGMNTTY